MDQNLSQIADRYDRSALAFADLIDGVGDDQWSDPTPCEEWNVRDLMGHIVDNHHHFQEMVGREPTAGPDVADDPAGAFATAADQTRHDLRDPDRAQTSYEGYFGRKTYAWAVDSFLTSDLVIHGWDLAQATGQQAEIPDDEMARISADAETWGDAARSPEVYGPAIDVGDDADDLTRFLGLVGRRA